MFVQGLVTGKLFDRATEKPLVRIFHIVQRYRHAFISLNSDSHTKDNARFSLDEKMYNSVVHQLAHHVERQNISAQAHLSDVSGQPGSFARESRSANKLQFCFLRCFLKLPKQSARRSVVDASADVHLPSDLNSAVFYLCDGLMQPTSETQGVEVVALRAPRQRSETCQTSAKVSITCHKGSATHPRRGRQCGGSTYHQVELKEKSAQVHRSASSKNP